MLHRSNGGGMKYLVIGCAGFVGSAVVEELLKQGKDVVGVYRTHRNSMLGNSQFKDGTDEILDIIKERVVIDCSWNEPNNRNDVAAQQVAYKNAVISVTQAIIYGASKYVHMATIAEYESAQNEYTKAKAMFHAFAEDSCSTHKLPYVACVIVNAFGMTEPKDSNRLVRRTIRTLSNGDTVTYSTSCNQAYDFMEVHDLARAVISLASGGYEGTYLMDSGEDKSLREYLEEVKEVVGDGDLSFGDKETVISVPAEVLSISALGIKPSKPFKEYIEEMVHGSTSN